MQPSIGCKLPWRAFGNTQCVVMLMILLDMIT